MTTGVLATSPILQFTLNNGELAIGGSIRTQIGGVDAPTYTDAALTTPLPNPIPLNSRGEVSDANGNSRQLFVVPNQVYTWILFDANGNQIWSANYVNGVQVSGASVAPLLADVIDQAIIFSFQQTAAENAAGVLPTNYAYAPGDVRRYGADATGNADSASAFNAAHSIAGLNVIYPQGTFKIGSNLNPPRCASIMGAGGYLFGGTCLKPQAAVTKLFSITSTGGNYPEYIGRFSIDGTATTNATGVVLGDSSGAVHVDMANIYIGNFTGSSGFGLKIANTLQTWLRHVYIFGCGTNYQLQGDTGFPTTTKLTACQADSASAGQGMAILSGYDIVLDDMVFQSSTAEGLKIIPSAAGVCRNIVVNRPWFENNHAAYHMVVDGSSAGATAFVRVNEPYFAVGASTALAANITGSGADVLFRAPTFTSSVANNIVYQNSAFGRIDQWDNFWSYDSNVTDSAGKVMGWEGPLNSWNPTITGVGSGGSISGVAVTARWRRVAVNLLFIEVSFSGTVAGTPNYLNVTIPSGFTLKNAVVKYAALITNNGIEEAGGCLSDGVQGLRFYRMNSVLYAAGTGGGIVQGIFEVVG